MPQLSDSEDEPTPEPYPYTTNTSNAKRSQPDRSEFTESSDSSEDEETRKVVHPAKRMRPNPTGASSQSSSEMDNSSSDHLSQPESETEAPPSFLNLPSFQSDTNQQPKALLSGIGERIMKGKGYVEGKGLGKYGQGRVEPIQASTQRGRVGFGFQSYSKGKKYDGPRYDPSMEHISAVEKPIWMDESPDEQLDRDLLDSWMTLGPKR